MIPEPDLDLENSQEREIAHDQESGLYGFTEALLKTELQQRKPESKNSVVKTSRPRPPMSADASNRHGAPSMNPFAAGYGRERKKPRLAVQTG